MLVWRVSVLSCCHRQDYFTATNYVNKMFCLFVYGVTFVMGTCVCCVCVLRVCVLYVLCACVLCVRVCCVRVCVRACMRVCVLCNYTTQNNC